MNANNNEYENFINNLPDFSKKKLTAIAKTTNLKQGPEDFKEKRKLSEEIESDLIIINIQNKNKYINIGLLKNFQFFSLKMLYRKKISTKTTDRSDKNGPDINERGNNIIKKFDIFRG